MPIYEYACQACMILFEETLTLRAEIEEFREEHPCPQCGTKAAREKVAAVNFSFVAPAGQTAGTGVHGQSGVHDLDYPKLDKAVGRSASKKWEIYDARKNVRDKVRREAGSNSIALSSEGKLVAADKKSLDQREKAFSTFKAAKEQAKKLASLLLLPSNRSRLPEI